jgi:hypothetical protein
MAEIESISNLIAEINPNYKKGPAEEHTIIYDSSSETLEPVYFWILDYMNNMFKKKVIKIVDNFTSSPGSGHFGELGQRASIMQQQASKIMGDVNIVLKSILNLIYDLREFQLRLSHYKGLKSSKKEEKEASMLALKQIWMDNVDIKRGRGSINMLAQDLQFVTIRDAFMIIEDEKLKGPDGNALDLNDRVKRILEPRIKEFNDWVKRSEIEMKKRYEIEKTYLKSQVASLKLYSQWAKPYLRAAQQLSMGEQGRRPELVTAFNTIALELTLLGRSEFDIKDAIDNRDYDEKGLPYEFRKINFKRKYYSCVIIDFMFRGIPQRVSPQQSHYAFGGRAEVTMRAYSLNDEELKMLDQKLEKSSLQESLKLVEGMTEESISQIQSDIDEFLKEDDKKEEVRKEDTNPFLALFGFYKNGESKKQEDKKKDDKKIEKIDKDNYAEAIVRKRAEAEAMKNCFNIFDIYKKAHGMESVPFEKPAK